MANQVLVCMGKSNKKISCYDLFILFTVLYLIFIPASFANEQNTEQLLKEKEIYLTNLNHINITYETAENTKKIKELIKEKKPKAIYIEQWIIADPKHKKLLKQLRGMTTKDQIKLYLVIGKNTWWGDRGKANAIGAYDLYGKYIDGLVLRIEPNKTNLWKKIEDEPIFNAKATLLNLMLDAYSAIYLEAKKRKKAFIAEFPFWFTDFKGPYKSFSQNVCDYAHKVSFLIDSTEKLEELDLPWNSVTCTYNINLTKRALSQTDEGIKEIYNKLKTNLTFYANFNGFIIDSDSKLLEDSSS